MQQARSIAVALALSAATVFVAAQAQPPGRLRRLQEANAAVAAGRDVVAAVRPARRHAGSRSIRT